MSRNHYLKLGVAPPAVKFRRTVKEHLHWWPAKDTIVELIPFGSTRLRNSGNDIELLVFD